METDFKVKIGEFEGPLELLLDLIEKRKLHISEVSLSQVADEFIEHIRAFEEFPMADSADFILIASTLLLIKSKSLLPTLDLSEEEKGSIEDLEERLAAYKRYKDLAKNLEKMFGNFLYFSQESKVLNAVFSPTEEVNLENLKSSLLSVIEKAPKTEILPKIKVGKIISLEEMIEKLKERVTKSIKMSFSSFSKGASAEEKMEKVNVIVSFLAMLELVKRGSLRAVQEKHFEEIELESEAVGVPQY
ncbi:MAG TPA: ScpA family protein [Candidatus Paceibacterota bacterium]